jgi:hypothetical protein
MTFFRVAPISGLRKIGTLRLPFRLMLPAVTISSGAQAKEEIKAALERA